MFIISSPSGGGKTTLCRKLVRSDRNIVHSISMTTRAPRKGEKDKRDYYFLTQKNFKKAIRQKRFLEWTKNYGDYYGTPRRLAEDNTRKGKYVLLSIDVKGAMQIRKKNLKAVFIFLVPPSLKELKKRLHKRNTEHRTSISTRLAVAKKELSCISGYDYIVVNDSIKKAFAKLKIIIAAEKCRP